MAVSDKELYKFVNNPKYRDKVVKKIHKSEDDAYNKRIKKIESECGLILTRKSREIESIKRSRWNRVNNVDLAVNYTEGKILINNREVLFSSIKGAELKEVNGVRTVITENTKTKSRKHASIGGAVAGGLIAGPVGAVVGGSVLGKTKGKTTGTTSANEVPTCIHMGVLVNIDGFMSEIVLLSHQVDLSSFQYTSAQKLAYDIIGQLNAWANTPVPESYIEAEDEESVRLIEIEYNKKQEELQEAIADKPTYEIPEIYRTNEQKEMSSEEYLLYLKNADEERVRQKNENENAYKQEQAELKEALKREQAEKRALNKQNREEARAKHKQDIEQKLSDVDLGGKAKKVGIVIYKIVFWILSVFIFMFSLIAFTASGVLSGIVLLLTALLINPLIDDIIEKRVIKYPRWIVVIILLVGFIVGVIAFPHVQKNNNANTEVTTQENT